MCVYYCKILAHIMLNLYSSINYINQWVFIRFKYIDLYNLLNFIKKKEKCS